MKVTVVPTGVANIASVAAAFRRLDALPLSSEDPDTVLAADRVVLPGVGAFGPAMARLRARGLDEALQERIGADRPTLAVCVGHQLLFETSDESPGERGLGLIPSHIGRFPEDVRVPQFGWNAITPGADCRMIRPGWAYFANSYRAVRAPGFNWAVASHGGDFVAGIERGTLLTCQFHPELSGAYGHELLGRWLKLARC